MERVTSLGDNIPGTEMLLVPIQAPHSQNLRYLEVKSSLALPLIITLPHRPSVTQSVNEKIKLISWDSCVHYMRYQK